MADLRERTIALPFARRTDIPTFVVDLTARARTDHFQTGVRDRFLLSRHRLTRA